MKTPLMIQYSCEDGITAARGNEEIYVEMEGFGAEFATYSLIGFLGLVIMGIGGILGLVYVRRA